MKGNNLFIETVTKDEIETILNADYINNINACIAFINDEIKNKANDFKRCGRILILKHNLYNIYSKRVVTEVLSLFKKDWDIDTESRVIVIKWDKTEAKQQQ